MIIHAPLFHQTLWIMKNRPFVTLKKVILRKKRQNTILVCLVQIQSYLWTSYKCLFPSVHNVVNTQSLRGLTPGPSERTTKIGPYGWLGNLWAPCRRCRCALILLARLMKPNQPRLHSRQIEKNAPRSNCDWRTWNCVSRLKLYFEVMTIFNKVFYYFSFLHLYFVNIH